MQNLVKGVSEKLNTDDHDNHGNDHGRNIFDSCVTEGVSAVCGFGGNLEADERNELGTRVGEVVETVRRHGHRGEQKSRDDFTGREQEVDNDSDDADHGSVGAANHGIPGLLPVFYEQPCKER